MIAVMDIHRDIMAADQQIKYKWGRAAKNAHT